MGSCIIWRKWWDRIWTELHVLHLQHFCNFDWWRLQALLWGMIYCNWIFPTVFLLYGRSNSFLSACRWPMLCSSTWRCCSKEGQIKGKCLPSHLLLARFSLPINLLFVELTCFGGSLGHKLVSRKDCLCGKHACIEV